ncbi:MAG: glycosyltransferase, partial [Caldisericia bacterium]|nr:glycosyltransferase [Caldisericia bacterium]
AELFEEIINCDVGMLTYKNSTQSSLPYAFSAFYKPLIVTNHGGLKEQVSCDFAEIVATNSQSITEAILKIKKRKIKKEAFENFLEEFSWDNTVSKYIKLYKEIVNE